MSKQKYIKSPLNYTGGKYKILPQLLPLFPENIGTFVDLFCGGCNIAFNVNAERVIANDIMPQLIGLFNTFKEVGCEGVLRKMNELIGLYELSKTNAEGYNLLRSNYNKSTERNSYELFALICHSFNHQIRFNRNGEFNMPFGRDRSAFNPSIEKNLRDMFGVIGRVTFTNKDFRELKVEKLGEGDFVYCDPPYLITCASYNEQNGWNEECERDLLSLMDRLNDRGVKFGLSNVIENKGERNEILAEWSTKYTVHHLSNTYANCSYHKKDRTTGTTDEVLIVNY